MSARITVGFLVSTLLFAAAGCGKELGTCVQVQAGSEADQCTLNVTEDLCKNGKFYPEKAVAGLVRCKGEGFEEISGARPPAKDDGQARVLLRHKK